MPYRLLMLLLLLAGVLVVLGACGNTDPVGEEPVTTPTTVEDVTGEGPDPEDVVSGTATVRYVDLEGGFYGLVTQQEQRYLPQNLPDSLRQDGLAVRFRGEIQTDVMTIQQWGTPIDLIDIARVEVLDE